MLPMTWYRGDSVRQLSNPEGAEALKITHDRKREWLDWRARLLLFAAFCSLTVAANSQPQSQGPQYVISVWSSSDAGPENRNALITQTPDGYLWTILEGSLVRFDGVRFTVFNSDNTPE